MTPRALAVRNLLRHRRRTATTLGALVLGVASIVSARGYVNALHLLMLEGAVHGSLGAIQVHKRGYSDVTERSPLAFAFEDDPTLRAKISAVTGVRAVAGRIHFPAMLANPEGPSTSAARSSSLIVTGLEPALERSVTPRRFQSVAAGHPLEELAGSTLWLQRDVAAGLGADPLREEPDEARWPALLASDADRAPNGEAVQVRGTLEAVTSGDRRFAVVPLALAQRVLRLPGRVTEYGVAVEELARVNEVRDQIQAVVGPDYEVEAWGQRIPLLLEMFAFQNNGFTLLSAMLLLVVLLTAINNQLMNVLDRVGEIGTMMALGMRRASIATLFVWEGALVGSLGASTGAVVGLGLVRLLDAANLKQALAGTTLAVHLAFSVGPSFVGGVVIASAVASVVTAFWPAWHASQLQPIDALRQR